jgi:DNA-binding MarR family transcriptional regulator
MKRLFLEEFIPYRLSRLGASVSEKLKGVYGRKFGLTIPEWRVLATLGQFERLTATAIGAHSAMHKAKVSRAVRDLEIRRWLTRTGDAEDRRLEFLELTRAGRQAYSEVVPDMMAFEEKMRKALGPRHTATVQEALDSLEAALGITSQFAKPKRRLRS